MIAIIDYGMGNLRSVEKAFEHMGHAATITDDPAVVADAQKLVLPGVGAFRDAIAALEARELVGPIKDAIATGKPFLGICLGLQMLFERSFEDGEYRGLGVIPGDVVRFYVPPQFKVPHMGWNQLRFLRRPPIFEGVAEGAFVYFVHSYYVVPDDPAVSATDTPYGVLFTSSVVRDNVFACQFHPEKSQAVGLRILANFAAIVEQS